MILLAVVLGARSALFGETEQSFTTSPLVLQEPADGMTIGNPVELIFTTDARLGQTPMGWGADSLHLHVAVNGRDVMPSGQEISRLDGQRFRWMLRLPEPGEYTLRLFWSGPDHAPLTEGASAPVRVRVAP